MVKFTGAGQGTKALVAEIVVGELGRRLGIAVPELALIEVDAEIGRREPDEEVQDLVAASAGTEPGHRLPAGLGRLRPELRRVGARTRPAIVWLDAFVANVDRSARNTNLLIWHKSLWAIDHGACLRFHHAWGRPDGVRRRSATTTATTCSAAAGGRATVHDEMAAAVTPEVLARDPGRRARRLAGARPEPAGPGGPAGRGRGPARATRTTCWPGWRRRSGGCREPSRFAFRTPCCGPCPGSTAASSSTSA